MALLRAIALFTPGAPSGIDGGNWLAFGTFFRAGMLYPPLVPALFSLLVGLVGPPIATAIAGAVAGAAPAVAILALLVWARRPMAGAMAALVVVSSRAIGEMVAWGGYPQPLATAFALVAIVALTKWLIDGSRDALVTFALGFAALAATSHLVVVPASGAIGLLLLGAILHSPRVRARRAAVAVGLAVLPILALAPTYLALFGTLGGVGAGQPGDAERVLGLGWPMYMLVLGAVPLAAVCLRRIAPSEDIDARDLVLLLAASAAAVSWLCAYLISGEPRLLHDVAPLALFGAGSLVPVVQVPAARVPGLRPLLAGAGFVTIIGLTMTGLMAFPAQVAYYHLLSPDQFAALEWLKASDVSSPRTVLVADVRGVPVGWWAEGMVGHEVLFASDLRWLRFPDELARAEQANKLLYASGFPGGASATAVHDAGIKYVFLPSAIAFGINTASLPSGWRLVFSSGDAVVLSPEPDVAAGGAQAPP
jgi:hypothetical protein